MTDAWWRSANESTAVFTEDMLKRARDQILILDDPRPNTLIVYPRTYRWYDFLLRKFDSPLAHIQWRFFLPAWVPHVAWGRSWRWVKRKWMRSRVRRWWRDRGEVY